MNYANIITQAVANELPKVPSQIGSTFNPDAKQQAEWLKKQGWRRVVTEESPTLGNRVTATKVVDAFDGETCRIQIVSQINMADEQAAQAAEAAKQATDRHKAMVEYLCQGETVRMLVALHNSHLGKEIPPEDVQSEAEKLVP